MPIDATEHLDYASRWLRDGLRETTSAGAVEFVDIDVSAASRILSGMKADGKPVTWTHVFVCAVARTLARNPDLHQLVAGNRRVLPSSVDICLSVAGEGSVTPTIVIEDAANKDIFTLASEVARRLPDAVRENQRLLAVFRRWGWILPFSAARRALIRFLLRQHWYRRKVSGTFQVSCVPEVDIFAPLLFNTSAAVGIGRVRDRVIAQNGLPVVRPMVTLACCLDHSVWNGMTAARFLTGLRQVLETGDFASVSEPKALGSAAR